MTRRDRPRPDLPAPGEHGGDLAAATARFGRPSGGWLDLSTGVNPHAYPVSDLPAACWTRLPQADREADLLAAARAYYGSGPEGEIVVGPGTQALIQILPRLLPPRRVAVVSPTYGEHALAWKIAGHGVTEIPAPDAVGDAQVCVLANPNNPDGRAVARETLADLLSALDRRDGLLVIDEAFADLDPAMSLAPEAGRPALVLLRSLGKFFGLPGARLGFALAGSGLADALRQTLGPWATSGAALEIGRRALADDAWIASTRARLASDAARLDALLGAHGLAVIGGTVLFRLVGTPHAARLHEHLGRHGILTRVFSYRTDWIRFGLPGDEDGFARLGDALAAFTPLPPRSRR